MITQSDFFVCAPPSCLKAEDVIPGGVAMSILFDVSDEKMTRIARKVFERHFEIDPKLDDEYDDRRKMLMYQDILYNLGFLNAAIEFDEDRIFNEYAVWIYHLLCNLMKEIKRERIKD